MPSVSINNHSKAAPKWFRKLKKIWSNSENLVIAVLLLKGYGEGSLAMLLVKMGSTVIFENLDTLLAEDVPDCDNEQ